MYVINVGTETVIVVTHQNLQQYFERLIRSIMCVLLHTKIAVTLRKLTEFHPIRFKSILTDVGINTSVIILVTCSMTSITLLTKIMEISTCITGSKKN